MSKIESIRNKIEFIKKKLNTFKRNIVGEIIKKCIKYLDKDNDLLAYHIGVDERKDYIVTVERFYDDHYTSGTMEYYYNKEKETA